MEFTVRKERKVLKTLIRSYKSSGCKPVKVDKSNNTYYINQLASKGFICFEVTDKYDPKTSTYQNKPYRLVNITDKGLHYFEKRFENLKILTLKNFWFPMAVAFITSLLTNGILVLLKQK